MYGLANGTNTNRQIDKFICIAPINLKVAFVIASDDKRRATSEILALVFYNVKLIVNFFFKQI